MATLRKRKDSWQVQVRKKGLPPITKSFVLKKDALTWANTIESEINRGVYVDRSIVEETTLDDVLERYSKNILPSLKGAKSELSRIKHLRSHFGRFSLAQIKPHDLAEYRCKRLSLVGPQSVKHELGLLNRILKLAHNEWGFTVSTP